MTQNSAIPTQFDETPRAATPAVSRILGYIGSVAVLRILVRVSGFGEKATLAYFFDLGELEAFWVALSVPTMALATVAAVTGPTILPMFVRRLRGGDPRGAWGQFHAWLLVILTLLVAAMGLCMVFVEDVARLLAPGFDAHRHELCVRMMRFLIPLVPIMGLLPFLAAFLNAQRRFLAAPFAELTLKLAMIAALLTFGASGSIVVAAGGAVLGAIVSLAVHLIRLKSSWRVRGAAPRYNDPDFRCVLFLMLAPGLGTLFARFGGIVENAAASTLAPGSVAALTLARKIAYMPLLVIPLASGTVLYTLFAELNQDDHRDSVARMLGAGARAMLFIFLPITVLTCVMAESIVAFVYQRGEFNTESVALVATVLFWLAPIMCLLSVEMLVMRHFFSRLDVWPPTLIGICCVGLKVALIVLFAKPWGLAGIAVAIVASRLVKVALLTLFVSLRGGVSVTHMEFRELLKLIPAAVLSGALALSVLHLLGPELSPSLLSRGLLLAIAGGVGASGYCLLAYVLGNKECHYVIHQLTARLQRPARSA